MPSSNRTVVIAYLLSISDNYISHLKLKEIVVFLFQFIIISGCSIKLSKMVEDASCHVIKCFPLPWIKSANLLEANHYTLLRSIVSVN